MIVHWSMYNRPEFIPFCEWLAHDFPYWIQFRSKENAENDEGVKEICCGLGFLVPFVHIAWRDIGW